jgi:hypothetical protein
MPEAIARHLETRSGNHAGVLGLFLCRASRLPELITELIKVRPVKPVALSLVIDTGLGGVPKAVSIVESRAELLALRMVEMPAPADVDEVWLERVAEFVPDDVMRVIEPRRGAPEWLEGVTRVADCGYWPKLRCGGLSKENFPSVDEIADFLAVVTSGGVSFKATAGLHNAVRNTGEDGLDHHGFLNLLVATSRSLTGKDVRDALTSTDGPALAAEATALSEQDAHAVRSVFASYGSCSMQEPVNDLESLGLL